jgi:predicted TIM-barrel fold metal-dependent hydrolase
MGNVDLDFKPPVPVLDSNMSLGRRHDKPVRIAGADRMLFGTDMALLDARHALGKIVTADISHADKRQILGLTAIELLRLDK